LPHGRSLRTIGWRAIPEFAPITPSFVHGSAKLFELSPKVAKTYQLFGGKNAAYCELLLESQRCCLGLSGLELGEPCLD